MRGRAPNHLCTSVSLWFTFPGSAGGFDTRRYEQRPLCPYPDRGGRSVVRRLM